MMLLESYVVFLMDYGWPPYKDMNIPGSYIVEWVAAHCVSDGAAGWLLPGQVHGSQELEDAQQFLGPVLNL
jgi:hypothetical protein